ncbi:Cytochrome c oxidase assembly factor 3 [Caenorhabditis elegans]|uniref:Cytochrome c oxidase assembly factor 3 n=1 Tax=Caenorhabditis elegans TaxID=6239 RepID=G5EFL2_CAEEL|nr:Cytochrome c oxidase assembly factor 3 [Caenorhabditis elegans]CAE52904.1 Cytochrome c oxidase assembly factor 3 [Caenorhabditis elegans]|eukprot:NP_001022775.1 Cytochrome OXidase assembly protein [Caenorhabditis elegans]
MFWSRVQFAARRREDSRPLYRRIFTNRRLDIAHKVIVRSILGFLVFSTSYCIINAGIYYKFVRPIRQEERELLERELIEADKAGFAFKK